MHRNKINNEKKNSETEKNIETFKFWLRIAFEIIDIIKELAELIEWWNNMKGH